MLFSFIDCVSRVARRTQLVKPTGIPSLAVRVLVETSASNAIVIIKGRGAFRVLDRARVVVTVVLRVIPFVEVRRARTLILQ